MQRRKEVLCTGLKFRDRREKERGRVCVSCVTCRRVPWWNSRGRSFVVVDVDVFAVEAVLEDLLRYCLWF